MSASVLVPHGQARVPVGVGHSPAPRSPLLLQRARAMGPCFVPNVTHKSSCSPRMSSCIITRAVAEEQEVASAAPTPPAPQQKIRIKLKSYWVDLLQVAVDAILDVAKTTGATVSGPVPLPTRIRKWTVLSSPHVNKDAREQFEQRTHSRLLDVKNLSAETVDKLMQLEIPAGVNIDVKL
ncbi:PRPS10 [Auxenochlorella protothecoides x Auxenochlorella symbiontica]